MKDLKILMEEREKRIQTNSKGIYIVFSNPLTQSMFAINWRLFARVELAVSKLYRDGKTNNKDLGV